MSSKSLRELCEQETHLTFLEQNDEEHSQEKTNTFPNRHEHVREVSGFVELILNFR